MTDTQDTLTCDICIIGAGSGGLSVAAGTAQLGLDTILVEKDKMGGDCLNTGCVPSKALLSAAKKASAFRTSELYGIENALPKVDYGAVKDHVQEAIDTIAPHDSVERFQGLGVRVVGGSAAFLDDKHVQVNNGEGGTQKIKARTFIISTGSRAFVPPIKGLETDKILTNENIFQLREQPDHIVVIGGGPIGIEMAFAHRRLGCEVTILELNTIMPRDDQDLVKMLRQKLKDSGINVRENVEIRSIKHKPTADNPYNAQLDIVEDAIENMLIEASHILVATGRKVNVDGIGLDEAGIEFTPKGIKTDKRLRTNKKHIFAIGDVAGGPQFTHVAGYHAGIIIRNVCFRLPAKVDYAALPWVTYTDPELAQAGLTFEQAVKERGENNVRSHFFHLKEIDRAVTDRTCDGGIKVVFDNKNKIIGASILAPHAGEMISLWVLAIQKKMKLQDIAGMIMPYPTYGDLSKRAAGTYFTPKLFSDKTRMFVRWLQKIPNWF